MRRRRLLAVAAGLAIIGAGGFVAATRLTQGTGGALGPPRFVDETATAGIATTYDGSSDYETGGGVASFDCDGDGRPDLFVAGGANPSALYRNESPVGGPLRFVDAASGSGGAAAPASMVGSGVLGAYPLDIDGDGIADLAVLRTDGLRLLRGLGACRFDDATTAWSLDTGGGWTTALSASWETPTAPLPTLAVGRYLKVADGRQTSDCDISDLVRPAATGAGYASPVVLSPGYCTLSMLFSDWDGSGRRDLRVTNDRQYYVDGEEQLWRVAPGEAPRLYTDADGWRPLQIWGMGIASYDLTGDGHPEVYLTSQADNKLQTLAAGPTQPAFTDIALGRGVTVAQPYAGGEALPSTAWHPEFQDVNNDGLVDLFVSKGNLNTIPDYAAKDPSNLLIGQPDGTFREGGDAAGIVSYARGRGAAVDDFNLDGLPDLVQVNYGQPTEVWRNVGAGTSAAPAALGSWLDVRVDQPGPNRDAIGAIVEVRTGGTSGPVSRRELTVGGGHLGGELGWIHFGLGSARDAQVRMRWPDGEQGDWMPVAANQLVDVTRGGSAPVPWSPPSS
jgi:hypothetical protein